MDSRPFLLMNLRNPRGFEIIFRSKRVLFLVSCFLEIDMFCVLTFPLPASHSHTCIIEKCVKFSHLS